ncbi:MAG: putative selenate ABC transporter substrate-binding protein [Deltaproteobacteria bacterium]|nr:putative selenate ABC transporter substrate-binding protein [Deltaproteobacteria bacterium]
MTRQLARRLFLLLFTLFFLVGVAAADTLRLSAIPDEDPQELLRKYKPFTDYIEKEVGLEVKFVPVVDYAATVEGLAANRLDIVWYGGFTSVQAVERAQGATRLAMREEDASFKSVFVTRTDSGIKTLADLKGKTFAFGSVSSTSGHLMPRHFLKAAGVDPERDFKKFGFSGAHDATAAWVAANRVDAGALNFLVWKKLVDNKKIDTGKVHAFWTTPPYVDYVWVARGGVSEEVREKFKQALLKLDYTKPADKEIMDLQRTRKFIPAKDSDWDGIKKAAIAAGMLKVN